MIFYSLENKKWYKLNVPMIIMYTILSAELISLAIVNNIIK